MLDIAIISILALYGISGWRRGLVLSLISIVGYILSGIVAKIYSPQLTNYIINNTNIMNAIGKFTNKGIKNITEIDVANNMITDMAAKSIVGIVSFIIIFSVTSLVISSIGRIINKVASLPVLDEINSFGGMIFGLGKGLIIMFIILALVTLVMEVGNESKLNDYIEKTTIVKLMYDNNPIVNIVKDSLN